MLSILLILRLNEIIANTCEVELRERWMEEEEHKLPYYNGRISHMDIYV